jgi:5-methylcytosine-specific restriction endonuclease McrA
MRDPKKAKECSARYRAKYPERVKAATARWRAENPEKSRAGCAAWRAKNAEYDTARRKKYKEQARKRQAKRRAADPEKYRKECSEWRAKNPDKHIAGKVSYRERNKGKESEYSKEWRKKHPNASRIHESKRRARKAKSKGTLSVDITEKLFVLQRGKCAACNKSLKKAGNHLDHIIPLIPRNGGEPGRHEDRNMQLLCPKCNSKKSNKDPIKFMREMGYLL